MAGVDRHPDTESVSICIQLLEEECSSKSDLKAAIDLVIKICRNIQLHPDNEKFKKIKKESKSLADKVWKFNGGQQLLLAIGWTEVDGNILYLEERDLTIIITCLEDKLKIIGNESTPTSTSPIANCWTEEEMKEKEKFLVKEKERRLAENKKKKDEEKRLKNQIEADRDNVKAREIKASKATKPSADNNGMKRFSDIGVDLDGQGG